MSSEAESCIYADFTDFNHLALPQKQSEMLLQERDREGMEQGGKGI